MINTLAKAIHKNAIQKGFYDEEKNIATHIALIHSEVSEALEADRKGRTSIYDVGSVLNIQDDDQFKREFESKIKDTFEDEVADTIIRLLDLAQYKRMDVEAHIRAKMRYNSLREHKHGKKY